MPNVLGPQFQSKVKVITKGKTKTYTVTKHPAKKVADAVYDQLTEDYPKDALGWVHNIKWKGPINYPTDNIDFDDKNTWKAEKEPDKIRDWEARIKAAGKRGEHIKPAILIQRPKDTAMIPDGHHRTIAYSKLGEDVFAFVGYPARAKGPWDTLHDYQYKDDTGPQKGGNPGLFHYGKEPR